MEVVTARPAAGMIQILGKELSGGKAREALEQAGSRRNSCLGKILEKPLTGSTGPSGLMWKVPQREGGITPIFLPEVWKNPQPSSCLFLSPKGSSVSPRRSGKVPALEWQRQSTMSIKVQACCPRTRIRLRHPNRRDQIQGVIFFPER